LKREGTDDLGNCNKYPSQVAAKVYAGSTSHSCDRKKKKGKGPTKRGIRGVIPRWWPKTTGIREEKKKKQQQEEEKIRKDWRVP